MVTFAIVVVIILKIYFYSTLLFFVFLFVFWDSSIAGVAAIAVAIGARPVGVDVTPAQLDEIRVATRKLAVALQVKGLMNIQFATQGDAVFVLEVNPRASRTVPFVSKAIGVPMARAAARWDCPQPTA